MPPESPANNTGKDVAARRAGGGFTVRIPWPGVLLDAPKLESSKIWTTRRPDRRLAASGGKPRLQQSSPLEDSERCFRTVWQGSSSCRTVRRLHHCARPNFGRATGVQILDTGQAACDKLSQARVSPHPLLCLYRSARRFFLPPSRITGSDLPGRPNLAPLVVVSRRETGSWWPPGGCTVLRTCAAVEQPVSTVLARPEVPTS